MATELQLRYMRERVDGAGHHAALRNLAASTSLDKDTVDRCLRRARRADAQDAKRRGGRDSN